MTKTDSLTKTNSLIRILTGLSFSLLVGNCLRYIDGNMDKFYLRLGIAVVILIALYIKEFRTKNNFLTSAKDSFPYFIALYLFGLGTWPAMSFGFLLVIWDFAGEG